MISTLRQNYNICGFHLCTLNLEKSVRLILEKLGLVLTEEQRIRAPNNRRRSSTFLHGNGIIKEVKEFDIKIMVFNHSHFHSVFTLLLSQELDGSVPVAKPLLWKNQGVDYVGRAEDWDNFPNGRFGSSQSPGKTF